MITEKLAGAKPHYWEKTSPVADEADGLPGTPARRVIVRERKLGLRPVHMQLEHLTGVGSIRALTWQLNRPVSARAR